ncbi:hypothetical protein JTE90_021004 [Oedothorax gibbosus]|uniref:Secreted protein n=1 Tax=Oedothorax gibbosus TaxID=931172 RepID=A0AAV6U4M5_9ARAC|nr:hypothetical protein JTE90_021004 [Oedothorax gibbosus]
MVALASHRQSTSAFSNCCRVYLILRMWCLKTVVWGLFVLSVAGRMTSESKLLESEDIGEHLMARNAAPIFLCKGPTCVMNFIEKNRENNKRTGGVEEQKENTFYSGW